jgi:ankyrin repeat protein
VYCQLVEICGCIPARIRHALADLPETLDETYERTLREINKANREFAHRLFQFVVVAVRPLHVEELAELLAIDFEAGPIPSFHEDWRLEDPMHAVLSTCHSFLAIVDDNIYYPRRKVVQFSHFSVKEFLTSARLAEANDVILRRYHISETPAHTLAARACLGYLLHLDGDVTSDSLQKLPFTEYSAEYCIDHAGPEDVSRNVMDGFKELFDPSKPHLAVWIWIYDPSDSGHPLWKPRRQSKKPSPLRGTPLHYAALWDLHFIIELLINEHSQNVNSQNFTDSATPLHLASERGNLKVACMLIERGADVSALDKYGHTPLHLASKAGKLEVARMLIERGADVSAQDKGGQTPLHLASHVGRRPEVARMLIERGADVSAQNKDGQTPLHLASQAGQQAGQPMSVFPDLDTGHPDIARMLIEHGADVSAQDEDGQTPLHLASQKGRLEVARMLIERGASVSAQNKDGQTPLHLVFLGNWYPRFDTSGHPEVARMLIERGADVSTQDKDGRTPMHLASQAGQLEVIRMLLPDASVQN